MCCRATRKDFLQAFLCTNVDIGTYCEFHIYRSKCRYSLYTGGGINASFSVLSRHCAQQIGGVSFLDFSSEA